MALDSVNWMYIRPLLLQMGISIKLLTVNWILGCQSSISFAVLMNGAPQGFSQLQGGAQTGLPPAVTLHIYVGCRMVEFTSDS